MQVDIHVASLAEDTGDARDQLLAFLDQWIGDLHLILAGSVDRFTEVHALAAQYHGADGDALRFLIQVGNHEFGHVSADATGLVFAREHLDGVGAGKQRVACIVLDGALG